MTSEIRTNTLTSRAGLSTVTLTDSGPMFSGITTFVDNSTFSVGTGGTIHAPATNVMALGTNNIDAIKIDSSGNVNVTGILTASSFSGIDSDKISEGNTEAEVVDTGSDGHFKVTTEGTERLRIASDGHIFFANEAGSIDTTARLGEGHRLQLSGLSSNDGISVVRYNTSYGAWGFNLGRSRSGTLGTNTILANDDDIGHITFWGADGSDFNQAAQISAQVDGSPSDGTDMPGRLVFKTSADGSGSPTERLRITSAGKIGINTVSPTYGMHLHGTTASTNAYYYAEQSTAGASAGFRLKTAGGSHFSIYGGTSGSSLGIYDYNASAQRLTINANGHMGLGVMPNSNWPDGDFRAFQLGTGACIFGRGSGDEDRGGIAVNYYHSSGDKYIANGHGSRIYMADGHIYLQNAPSNSSGAGAAMTLNTRLQIDATDGHIDFTGSTSSTLGYVFQNGTSGASADTRVLIKSYANSGADPYIKFDAGGQDMIVGTSYVGTTNNLLCLGPGSVPSINNNGLRINGLGKTLLSYLAPGQDSIIDLQNKRTRANGHMYGVDFRDSSNESNANIVVKQNSSGNNAAEMRFYVNAGTGGNGITNGNLVMTLTQGGDVDIESDLDVGSTLSIANGYVTLQKRDSDDNTRSYIHSRGNAYGGNQALNGDNRSPSPSDFKKGCGMSCFFSSINGNNSGGYIDAMHFSTYSDSSGGSPTMLGMSKSGNNMYFYRHGWLNNGHMATTDYSNASKYSVSMSSVSDARAKEEVKSVANTDALSLVSQLRPVTYKWTDEYINDGGSRNEKENQFTYGTPLTEGGPPPATRVGISTANKVVNIGFIAQEVELVIPTVVHQDRVSIGGTTEHWKNIDYDKLVPYLTGAIKGLIEKVEVLEQDNIALRARVTNLEGN